MGPDLMQTVRCYMAWSKDTVSVKMLIFKGVKINNDIQKYLDNLRTLRVFLETQF